MVFSGHPVVTFVIFEAVYKTERLLSLVFSYLGQRLQTKHHLFVVCLKGSGSYQYKLWRSPYLAVWSFFPYLLRLRLVSSTQLAILWNYILKLQIIISWVLGHGRFFLVPYFTQRACLRLLVVYFVVVFLQNFKTKWWKINSMEVIFR